jgi:hypothetical protein
MVGPAEAVRRLVSLAAGSVVAEDGEGWPIEHAQSFSIGIRGSKISVMAPKNFHK